MIELNELFIFFILRIIWMYGSLLGSLNFFSLEIGKSKKKNLNFYLKILVHKYSYICVLQSY